MPKKTNKLQDHKSNSELSWNAKISQSFNFFSLWVSFCRNFRLPAHQKKGCDHFYSSLPFSLAHEPSYIYLQLCIGNDYLLFLIAVHAIITLLLDNIIPPPEFISLFITACSHKQAAGWILHRLSSC